jgi:hypothetical protein
MYNFHCGVWIEGYLFNLFCETFKCSRVAYSWTSFLHISTFSAIFRGFTLRIELTTFLTLRSLTRNNYKF